MTLTVTSPRVRGSSLSRAMMVLFWLHNLVFGSIIVALAGDLLKTGTVQGVIPGILLCLIWIGGSITFGIAAIVAKMPRFANGAQIEQASATAPKQITPS